jgi:hypothetical protein
VDKIISRNSIIDILPPWLFTKSCVVNISFAQRVDFVDNFEKIIAVGIFI